jgi:DNA-binding beta-propeller fold protein YncE
MVRTVVALVAIALLGAGCRHDAADSADPGEPPTPSAVTETARPLADVLVQRFDVGLGPDWMALDEHGLWVKQDRSPVLLVDPATGRQLGQVETGYELPLCQGIGAAYDVVYVCRGTDLLHIDPETMKVVRRVPLHKEYGQGHIPGAFGRFWVLESDGSTLTALDPATDKVVNSFKLPARGFDLAAGPDGLWVACKIDDKVLEIDPDTGAVLVSADVNSPEYVTVGDQVWAAGESQTYRIDPDTGAVLATVEAGAEPDGSIAQDDHYVYVRNATDFLVQIDKATGTRAARIVSDTTSGGDVAIAGGDVWATAVDDLVLIRLRSEAP